MLLKSNIGHVIRRLQRYQTGVVLAVERAVAPAYWTERLRHVAHVTLRAQWALERNVQTRARYEALTPQIVTKLFLKRRSVRYTEHRARRVLEEFTLV